MRSKGTAAELEARRRMAVRRVDEGWAQKDVAAFFGVHPVTVAKWVARYRAGGADGLKATPTPGRPRFLTAAQERKVLGWLAEPPTEHGFRTDLWTARRVAERILQTFGVRFHPNYLRAWLADRGYTPQKPARRARQRDRAAIDRWVAEDWPRIQKRPGRTGPTSS
jgi:transposase